MAYLVKRQLKLLADGLEREPGQQIAEANFVTCPGLRDALIDEGVIVPIAIETDKKPSRTKRGKNAVS